VRRHPEAGAADVDDDAVRTGQDEVLNLDRAAHGDDDFSPSGGRHDAHRGDGVDALTRAGWCGGRDVRGARAAGARQQGGGRQCDQRTDSTHFVLT
jgi:hypothetical protein